MPPAAEAVAPDLIARFRDARGEPADAYDFSLLGLPPGIAPWFAEAFRWRLVASAVRTRSTTYKALRTFSDFIRDDGRIEVLADIDPAAVERFVAWLHVRRRKGEDALRSPSALAGVFSCTRKMLAWLQRHKPDLLPRSVFPVNPFPLREQQVEHHRRLTEAEQRAVLEACYAEIDDAWAAFQQGRRILAGDDGADPDLAEVVRALHGVGSGIAPSAAALRKAGVKFSRVTDCGGLRAVTEHLHVTYDTLVPFYVALAIQTAANPEPLRLIRRDCLVPHPLDEQREYVDWVKPRAGGRFRRPQRRSFDLRRPYAAPHLIRKLLALTEPLLPHAGRESGRLFLAQNEKTRRVAVMQQSSLGHVIARFVRRSNQAVRRHNRANPARPRTLLPDFAPVALRGSVGSTLYQATGGDIVAVQGALNHASAATTEGYVAGPQATRMREQVIARAQRFMLAHVSRGGGSGGEPPAPDPRPARGIAHDCLDPLGGSGPGAEAGRACPHLGGCLACPGLVVPLDVEHLARLLQLRTALEAARERLEPPRWLALYAGSHRAVVERLLPEFPSDLMADAVVLAASRPPLPELE